MVSVPVIGRRGFLRRLGFYVLLVLVLSPFMFVFYYMVTTSLKTPLDINAPSFKWVFRPTFDNYRDVFLENDFLSFTMNSFIVAAGSTALALIIGVPAAFAVARYRLPRIAVVILASRVTPGITFLIPWFILFSRLGWIDTYQSLILAHLLVNLPLVIWMMISYFEDLPSEMFDSAAVDGATVQRTLMSIGLPLVRGGIAATSIIAFIFSWNNFMFSVVLAGPSTRTLPVAVFNFMSYGSMNWGAITAAATIMTLPVLIMALAVQRQLIAGLTMGADR